MMSASKEVKAKFNNTKFKLVVTKPTEGKVVGSEAGEAIECGATCETEVEEGAKVTLEAIPAAKHKFEKWTEGEAPCVGTNTNPCKFTMPGKEVKAAAEVVPSAGFPLTVFVTGKGEVNGSGIVACKEAGGTCEAPEVEVTAELTAKVEPGSVFAGWIGCKKAVGLTCKVEMTEAREVTAVFLLEGTKGTNGTNGEGVTIKGTFSGKGEHNCPEGGIELELTPSTTKAYLCNGARGTNGASGKEGKKGETGEPGAAGAKGANGAAGPAGKEGQAGKEGKEGPAGKMQSVTCTKKGKRKKCTTRTVTGAVSLPTSDLPEETATLSRHGAIYATGSAFERKGRLSLRLSPLRALRPGRYTLTVVSGSGRHERIHSESLMLR